MSENNTDHATEDPTEGTPDPAEGNGVTNGETDAVTDAAAADGDTDGADDGKAETFPRTYVEKLRKESADHRTKAADRDALAIQLHTALVAATGRLADPSDLAFHEAHISDPDALTTALDDLLARKPHFGSRQPRGDVGQGVAGDGFEGMVDLAGMLRAGS